MCGKSKKSPVVCGPKAGNHDELAGFVNEWEPTCTILLQKYVKSSLAPPFTWCSSLLHVLSTVVAHLANPLALSSAGHGFKPWPGPTGVFRAAVCQTIDFGLYHTKEQQEPVLTLIWTTAAWWARSTQTPHTHCLNLVSFTVLRCITA